MPRTCRSGSWTLSTLNPKLEKPSVVAIPGRGQQEVGLDSSYMSSPCFWLNPRFGPRCAVSVQIALTQTGVDHQTWRGTFNLTRSQLPKGFSTSSGRLAIDQPSQLRVGLRKEARRLSPEDRGKSAVLDRLCRACGRGISRRDADGAATGSGDGRHAAGDRSRLPPAG